MHDKKSIERLTDLSHRYGDDLDDNLSTIIKIMSTHNQLGSTKQEAQAVKAILELFSNRSFYLRELINQCSETIEHVNFNIESDSGDDMTELRKLELILATNKIETSFNGLAALCNEFAIEIN